MSQLSAHELAKILLDGPDQPVYVRDTQYGEWEELWETDIDVEMLQGSGGELTRAVTLEP